MRTNRKAIGMIVALIAFIILVAIIYLSFFANKQKAFPGASDQEIVKETPNDGNLPVTTPGDKPRNYQKYDILSEPEHKLNENDLSKIAMAFSERLGSYSNQSNYGNFTDLKIFMTDSLKAWADKYVAQLKKEESSTTNYYGISTKSLTSQVLNFDDKKGIAKILVTTQRRENTAQMDGVKGYIQKIEIDMVKDNGEWLVNKAYWQ